MLKDLQNITKQNKLSAVATVNSADMLALIIKNNELQQECDNLRNLKVMKQSLSDNFNQIVALTADEKTAKIFQLQKENEDLRLAIYSIMGGMKADEFFKIYGLIQHPSVKDNLELKRKIMKAVTHSVVSWGGVNNV